MEDQTKSVLVVGFNTRPLALSLKNAGYDVYAVDFFGDLDLYPSVVDSLILIKELETDYGTIKGTYSKLLSEFTVQMLKKYPRIDYLIIGSGLDDSYEERKAIINEIKKKNYRIKSLNNDVETIENARNIEYIHNLLKFHNFKVPLTISYIDFGNNKGKIQFPLILKKSKSAGGLNIYKISTYEELSTLIKNFGSDGFNQNDWLIQEYIEGIPISCSVISNGKECEILTINRQLIGDPLLNPPKEFTYCGNIVPAELSKRDEKLVIKITKTLTLKLGLKGVNGFDYVLKDHYPYLMEVNPRIPGSIRASEVSLDANLLDLHIKSFNLDMWDQVRISTKSNKPIFFVTKFIFFAPKEINKNLITIINSLDCVHDKSTPTKSILKGEPLCTILYKGKTKLESYNRAKNTVIEINKIIK